jgi:hypothetical protein
MSLRSEKLLTQIKREVITLVNNILNISIDVGNKIDSSEKGVPNGVASLNGSGQVPASQLPSYVDDVEEYPNLASFPVTGETGKIYVALDTNKTYRWTGSTYVEISQSEGDMLKSVYDTGDNGVVDNSELLEGNNSAYHLNRANHSGTQTASTISDFDTEVSNNTDVAANTLKVSADGSVTTHSDVNSTTTAVLTNNIGASVAPTTSNDDTENYSVGSFWLDTTNDKIYQCIDSSTGAAIWKDLTPEYGTEYNYFESTTTGSTTGAQIIYLTLTTSNLSGGTYRLNMNSIVQNTSAGGDWEIQITEGIGAAGTNINLIGEDIREEVNSGVASQRHPRPYGRNIVFTPGVKNINIELDQFGAGTFNIFQGSIELFKISN